MRKPTRLIGISPSSETEGVARRTGAVSRRLVVVALLAVALVSSFAAARAIGGPALHATSTPSYLAWETTELVRVLDLPQSPDITPAPGDNFYIYSSSGLRWIYEPANKVVARVRAAVSFAPDVRLWVYRYMVDVSDSSPLSLWIFGVDYDDAEIQGVESPQGWRFSPRIMGRPVVNWGDTLPDRCGIPPGAGETGFELRSPSPPGRAICYARGYTDIPVFPYGEAPEDPRPKFFGDVAIGETVGPNATSVAGPEVPAPADWVGLRDALASGGWTITWKSETGIVDAVLGNAKIQVQVGNAAAEVNGHPLVLSAQPRLRSGVLEIPRADIARLLAAASQ